MKQDELSQGDVYDVLQSLSYRDITDLRTPDGDSLMLYFQLDAREIEQFDFLHRPGRYVIIFSLRGNVWFEYDEDRDMDTLWKYKPRY